MKTSMLFVFLLATIVTCIPEAGKHDFIHLQSEARAPCLFDIYQPCQCEALALEIYISCDSVPVEIVQFIFENSPFNNIAALSLTGNYTSIPANLTADKRILAFGIDCAGGTVEIDTNALRTSENSIIYLTINGCNLADPGFVFLDNFTALKYLIIEETSLDTFPSLPSIPNLQTIYLWYCSDLSDWYNPSNTPALNYISIDTLPNTEDSITNLLGAISYYNETLHSFDLMRVGLTQIPSQINRLSQLNELYLDGNFLYYIPTASLEMSSKIDFFSLYGSSIENIEPGAFIGDFSSAVIFLRNNNLMRFEESVFLELLQTMTDGGRIYIDGNPIACDCGLAWLLRDNRELLPFVSGGLCSNGIAFEDLDPSLFNNCNPMLKTDSNIFEQK